ncbi:MAG: hypothetical protein NXI25_00620 [bacterium]|nr:hypothetical protein [bacterium]
MTRRALVLIMGLLLSLNMLAQKVDADLPAEVVYEMKRQLLKNTAFNSFVYFSRNKVERNGKDNAFDHEALHSRKSGFGFLPGFFFIRVEKSVLDGILGKEYTLYEVDFSRQDQENNAIDAWANKKFRGIFPGSGGLFAMKNDGKVLLLNGEYGTTKNFSKVVKTDTAVLKSFEAFFKILRYRDLPDGITVEKIINDTVVLKHVYEIDNVVRRVDRYYAPVNNPRNYRVVELLYDPLIEETPATRQPRNTEKATFSGTEDKKRYLFEALMENLYLYKFHQKASALPDSVDPETLLDSLIPDYDVYLPRMYHLRYGCCWESEERVADLQARLPEMMSFSYDYEWEPYVNAAIAYKCVSAEHRFYYRDIEYYKIYMDTLLLWHKREDSQFADSMSWDGFNNDNIYDTYYQPQWKAITERALRYSYPLVVSPEILPARYLSQCSWANTLDTAYNHYDYPYHYIKQPRANHYLLALDTETRDVYFISGKDIFLTKTVPLYLPYVEDKEARRRVPVHRDPDYSYLYKKGDWRMLFTYIQDRLYRYLVERLDRSNVIYEDEEKVVLRCKGEEYKKEIELEVTLYFDDPEHLEVRVL